MEKNLVSILRKLDKPKTPASDETRRLLSMMKPYKGVNYIRGAQKNTFNYYNEREWRYLPSSLKGRDIIMPIEDMTCFEQNDKAQMDDKTKNEGLAFTPDCVKYLLTDTIEDKINLMHFIDKIERYATKGKELLNSKIILKELLDEDI